MLSLVVYVPASHLEQVKDAMFAAGAGRMGLYDRCCWQTLGRGQFRALAGADPHVGKVGAVEAVDEWKVEMVCEQEHVEDVIRAMKEAHPYETAAFHVTKTIPL